MAIGDQFPVIMILAPMFGAILVILLGIRYPKQSLPVTLVTMGLSLFAAVMTCVRVLNEGVQTYLLSGWERLPERLGGLSVGIEYRIDAFNGIVLVVIMAVAFLNAIYSKVRVARELPDKVSQFYFLYLLLVAGLAGMTITNDAFNLYVLLEISSLTSYALIAIGSKRAALSAFNYVIMGTIGASFYLLGVGYLYIKTGTLNMTDIQSFMTTTSQLDSPSIQVAFMLIVIGLWVKMAFFPLHGWMPNAYAYAPTATGSLMAPLVTKVMIYIMIRMMITVFGVDYVFSTLNWTDVVVNLSAVAIVAGSFFALSRSDLRKMLTYLIVAEVGYMVGGAWMANYDGMVGAIYHIVSDAMMTLCLFFAIGIIITRTGEHRLVAFRGLFRKMPKTMIGFTVGAFSMIGLPPTCGVFSKWDLVSGGIEAGQWAYVGALIFSSLVNAVIFFRLIEMAYFHGAHAHGEPVDDGDHHHRLGHDPDATPEDVEDRVPRSMMVPLYVAAASLIVIGLFNRVITGWIGQALQALNLAGGPN